MPLVSVRTGRYSTASQWLDVAASLPLGDPAKRQLWIAPNSLAVTETHRRLAQHHTGAVFSPGVVTSQQLASRLLALFANPAECRPLDLVMSHRLVEEIVEQRQADGSLPEYGRLESLPAIVELLLSEIESASARGSTPAQIFSAAEQSGSPRQREFAEVYTDYYDRLTRHGLLDRELRWRRAAELLMRGGDKLPTWQHVTIAPWEVSSRSERDFLVAVLRRTDTASLTITQDDQTIAWLKDSLGPLQLETGREHDTGSNADLAFATQWLFQDPQEAPPPPTAAPQHAESGMVVIPADSLQAEAEAVARRIKRILLAGVPAEQIVIAAPHPRSMAARWRLMFEQVGVPLAIDVAPRLGEAAVIGQLMAILALPEHNWRHADLLRVITAPLLSELDQLNNDSSIDRRAVRTAGLAGPRSAAELAVRRLLLPRGRAELLDQLRREAEYANQRQAEVPADRRQRLHRRAITSHCGIEVVTRLTRAIDQLPTATTPLAWYDALRQLLDRLGYQTAAGAAERDLAALDLAALDLLEQALASLERLAHWRKDSQQPLSLQKLTRLLAKFSRLLSIDQRADSEGCVRLVSFEGATVLNPRHLYVVGLAEGAVPRSPGVADPCATDGRAVRETHQRQERQKFHALIASARESVSLGYPALDDKAQPLNPSSLVTEVERLFLPRSLTERPTLVAGPTSDQPAVSPAELRCAAIRSMNTGDAANLNRLVTDPATAGQAIAVLDGVTSTLWRATGDHFGPSEGVLAGEVTRREFAERYGSDHAWSPSQLELYAECPFKFFMRYGLNTERLESLGLDIDYRRRGSLLHDAMVRLHQTLPTGPASTEDEEFLARFEQAVDAAADSIGVASQERALLRVEAMQAVAWGPAYLQQWTEYREHTQALSEPMRPTYYEARFGPSQTGEETDAVLSTDSPFCLSLGEEKLQLTGRIDRIDVATINNQTVFNVVDYKTSALMKPSADKIRSGHQLQLFLYALAVERLLLSDEQAAPWRLGYWAICDGGFKPPKENRKEFSAGEIDSDGMVRSTEAWKSLEATVVERLGEIVSGIRRGQFPMLNENPKCTNHCEYAGVCRVAQARGVGKQVDPTACQQPEPR